MHVIGVDEVGRGALAGPVAVGVAAVHEDFDWSLLPGVRDSKLLSAAQREKIFHAARALARGGILTYRVAFVGAPTIDRIGITCSVALAIDRALSRCEHDPAAVCVKLDGLLRAPAQYIEQETIIKGDQLEPAISLASIMAKVTRDRYMVRMAQQFPHYRFEAHKGYGTRLHCAAIGEHGLCVLHRRGYCRGLL